MTSPTAALPDDLRDKVEPETVVPFTEGSWFAWRSQENAVRAKRLKNGVWWTADGQRVLSLAVSRLTGAEEVELPPEDYDVMAWVGAADACGDTCLHHTREEADACALLFLTSGVYCRDVI